MLTPKHGYPKSLVNPIYPGYDPKGDAIMVASQNNLAPSLSLLVPKGMRLWIYYGPDMFTYALMDGVPEKRVVACLPAEPHDLETETQVIRQLVKHVRGDAAQACCSLVEVRSYIAPELFSYSECGRPAVYAFPSALGTLTWRCSRHRGHIV